MENKSKIDTNDLIKMQNVIIMTLADVIEKKLVAIPLTLDDG